MIYYYFIFLSGTTFHDRLSYHRHDRSNCVLIIDNLDVSKNVALSSTFRQSHGDIEARPTMTHLITVTEICTLSLLTGTAVWWRAQKGTTLPSGSTGQWTLREPIYVV